MALYLVWTLMGFSLCAPPVDLDLAAYDLENYDDSNTWELNTYGNTYHYDDLPEEVSGGFRSFVSVSSFVTIPFKGIASQKSKFHQ